MSLLHLVRHGETEPNREGRLLGRRADPGLTAQGRAQAEALARRLAREEPVRVVTSPLRRCVETAEVVAAATGAAVVEDGRLVEIDYGEWEGVRLDELPADTGAAWRADPAFRPPGGESLAEVQARVAGWCEEQRANDGPVVAVSHVSPVKAAVIWALGGDPRTAWQLWVAVASLTTLEVGSNRALLHAFNDRSHLDVTP